MIYYVTIPEVYRHEQHPKLKTAHPDGFVEVCAKDETKARKYVNHALGSHWSVIYDENHFDADYFPAGLCGRVWKAKSGEIEMEVVG